MKTIKSMPLEGESRLIPNLHFALTDVQLCEVRSAISQAARMIHASGEINDEFQDRYWLEYTEAIYVRELIDFVLTFDQ